MGSASLIISFADSSNLKMNNDKLCFDKFLNCFVISGQVQNSLLLYTKRTSLQKQGAVFFLVSKVFIFIYTYPEIGLFFRISKNCVPVWLYLQ